MRKIKIMFVAAVLASAGGVSASLAAPTNNSTSSGHERSEASARSFHAQIAAVMKKNPNGGRPLVSAIEHLLAQNPNAIAEVIEASRQASHKQALALEQGVVQAEALLKAGNPSGAQQIQTFLDNNKANPVVAEILTATGSQGSGAPTVSTGGGDNGGRNSGGAGGAGGTGGLISPH